MHPTFHREEGFISDEESNYWKTIEAEAPEDLQRDLRGAWAWLPQDGDSLESWANPQNYGWVEELLGIWEHTADVAGQYKVYKDRKKAEAISQNLYS